MYGRSGAVEDPNAGLTAVIEHGSQRHLDFGLTYLARQPNSYRRAKRCCRGLTVEHIAGLIGTGLGIGGVRQLPEMRRIAPPIGPIHAGLGHRADHWPDGLGKRDDRFAGADLCDPNHGLARRDDLAGLANRFDHRSVRVRYQDRVGRLILCDPCFGFSGGELRLGCIQRGLRLLVASLLCETSTRNHRGISSAIPADQRTERPPNHPDLVVSTRERCQFLYFFVEDKLAQAVYVLAEKYSEPAEYLTILRGITKILTDKYGQPIAENIARCPRTMAALESAPVVEVPRRGPSSLFSLLAPKTRIRRVLQPHKPKIIPRPGSQAARGRAASGQRSIRPGGTGFRHLKLVPCAHPYSVPTASTAAPPPP